MKRIGLLILTFCCIMSLYSCANNHIDGFQDPNIDIEDASGKSVEEGLDTQAPDSYQSNENETVNAVGGSHMGDELYSPYSGYVDTVVYKEGTFSENFGEYMDEFDEMEGKWENDRPALMYYLAQKMNLTREDLEIYYAALGFENVPESIYKGLLTDSLAESMQLLKTEYAFYNDGKLYTVYDVYELEAEDKLEFNVTDTRYNSVWESISNYLETTNAISVSNNLMQFVNQNVARCKMKLQ